jgi:hypothetical protein
MAINAQKVVVGGLAAGIVAFVLDFVLNGLLLAGFWEDAMTTLNPALAEGTESPGAFAGFLIVDIAWGGLLVWLYAAIRPRFGPGAGTAFKAAVAAWLITGIPWSSLSVMGIFSWSVFVLGAVTWLVVSVTAVLVGARLYTEEAPAPGPAMGA